MTNCDNSREVVRWLGGIVVLCAVGTFALIATAHEVPGELVAVITGGVGALSGLARSPRAVGQEKTNEE